MARVQDLMLNVFGSKAVMELLIRVEVNINGRNYGQQHF